MSNKLGFIKLPRTIIDWQWYEDLNTFKLMTHLLIKANFKEKQWKGQTISPNQLITSTEKLAIQTGLTPSKVRTALKKLSNTKDIKIKTGNKFTKIEITASFYVNNQNDNQITTNKHSDSKELATTKNDKELNIIIKEFREEVFSNSQYSDKILNDFFNYWVEKDIPRGKLRFQCQTFWEVEKRLAKWVRNEKTQTKKLMLDIKR